jgi:hypothetical protein
MADKLGHAIIYRVIIVWTMEYNNRSIWILGLLLVRVPNTDNLQKAGLGWIVVILF